MSSIVIAVFKATYGFLLKKHKDGDETYRIFHSFVLREIDEIKSKLDGLSKKDLATSISFFEEGMEYLNEVLKIEKSRGDDQSLVKRLALAGSDELNMRKFSATKERFEDARRKASEAFKNESLKISDRILAMKYRVMATILETIDNPAQAVTPCRACVEELNCLPAVQSSFGVQLKKGFQAVRGFYGQEERREIISSVCHVNHVVYEVIRALGEDAHFWIWPPIDIGENKINPLYDARVTKVLLKQGMEHCSVTPWSFGHEGKKEHRLKDPRGIATNSSGEFIVGEYKEGCMKVFDSSGMFVKHFSLPNDDVNTKLAISSVVADMNDTILVPTKLVKPGAESSWWSYIPSKTTDPYHTFRLRIDWCGGLSVGDTGKVEEYDTNGKFVRSFGKGILKEACDITLDADGLVMVLDSSDSCVHIFCEHGYHLNKFKLQRNDCVYTSITFYRKGEHVVIAGAKPNEELLQVEVYSKDGEFVRSIEIQIDGIYGYGVRGITVTNEGRIGVLVHTNVSDKVLVF